MPTPIRERPRPVPAGIALPNRSLSPHFSALLEHRKQLGVALRGLFLIDPRGIIRQATINDLPVGRNVDEVIRLIEAFQYVETHGEVCPANWRPGARTMKPDPAGAQKYFQAHGEG